MIEEGDLAAEVEGEIVKDDKSFRIHRIEVLYRLRADPAQRETIERVHGFHADHCPVARTIDGCVEIATRLELVDRAAG